MTEPDFSMFPEQVAETCIHYCSFGCGNLYQFIVVTAADSTTQFLCVPCFVNTAMSMVEAMVNPDSTVVTEAVAAYNVDTVEPAGKRGRKASLIGAVDTGQGSEFLDEFEPDVSEAA